MFVSSRWLKRCTVSWLSLVVISKGVHFVTTDWMAAQLPLLVNLAWHGYDRGLSPLMHCDDQMLRHQHLSILGLFWDEHKNLRQLLTTNQFFGSIPYSCHHPYLTRSTQDKHLSKTKLCATPHYSFSSRYKDQPWHSRTGGRSTLIY